MIECQGSIAFLIEDTEYTLFSIAKKCNPTVEFCGTRAMHVFTVGISGLNYFNWKIISLAYEGCIPQTWH